MVHEDSHHPSTEVNLMLNNVKTTKFNCSKVDNRIVKILGEKTQFPNLNKIIINSNMVHCRNDKKLKVRFT